jgi:hypothetical protein
MLDCTVSASTPGLATHGHVDVARLMFVARISDAVGRLPRVVRSTPRASPERDSRPHTASDWSTDAMLSTDAWLLGWIVGSAAGSVAAAPPCSRSG